MQFTKAYIKSAITSWKDATIAIEDNRIVLKATIEGDTREIAVTQMLDVTVADVKFKCAQVHLLAYPDTPYIEVYRELFVHPATSMEVIEIKLMNKLKEIRKERIRLLEMLVS